MNPKSFLSMVREKFINLKIYYSRSIGYVSLINSGMILFLTVTKLKEMGIINWSIGQSFFWVYIFGVVGLVLIGWIEVKYFKGMNIESKRNFELTPPMVEMKQRIDYLYEKQKKEEERKQIR